MANSAGKSPYPYNVLHSDSDLNSDPLPANALDNGNWVTANVPKRTRKSGNCSSDFDSSDCTFRQVGNTTLIDFISQAADFNPKDNPKDNNWGDQDSDSNSGSVLSLMSQLSKEKEPMEEEPMKEEPNEKESEVDSILDTIARLLLSLKLSHNVEKTVKKIVSDINALSQEDFESLVSLYPFQIDLETATDKKVKLYVDSKITPMIFSPTLAQVVNETARPVAAAPAPAPASALKPRCYKGSNCEHLLTESCNYYHPPEEKAAAAEERNKLMANAKPGDRWSSECKAGDSEEPKMCEFFNRKTEEACTNVAYKPPGQLQKGIYKYCLSCKELLSNFKPKQVQPSGPAPVPPKSRTNFSAARKSAFVLTRE